tara:strand:+ start:40 stop:519 length:480 start_codon:yes stop_codon:yes gene_type:complete
MAIITLNKLALPSGSVVQVVQAVKTDAFTTSSTGYVDITGMSSSITPSSSSNKILISINIGGHDTNVASGLKYQIVRDSTPVGIGTISGNTACSTGGTINSSRGEGMHMVYMDSPSSTSSITYKVQGFADGSNALYVNFRNGATNVSSISTITLMEIQG